MQNKGLISALAVALILVCIYQLSFTISSYNVKKEAREYAAGDLNKELRYIDSIASLPKSEWGFLGNTFKEVQSKELNLGLDLKGGMNVVLEISVEDIVRALSGYSSDKVFNDAMVQARQRQVAGANEDFITLFIRSFEEIDPNARLAGIFGTVELRDRINFNSTNDDVRKVLEEEANLAIDNAFNVLRNRIDRFGVVQPNISHLQPRGRILVELPGVKDPQRVRDLLQGTANLEFWETYETSEIIGYLMQANEFLSSIQVDENVASAADTVAGAQQDTTAAEDRSLLDMVSSDTAAAAEASTLEEFTRQNPLFGLLRPNVSQDGQPVPGSLVGFTAGKDTAAVNAYLAMNQVKAMFPRELRFYWSQNPYKYDETNTLYELHAIKITTRDGRAPLSGDVVTSARPSTGVTGTDIKVDFSMNAEGAKIWQRMTRDNIGRCIAVVLDGYVRSYPRVQNEIAGGNTEITGDFSLEEAEDLSNILKSGKMPAPARIIQDTVVGPSLGKAAIDSGLKSFIVAFVIVLLYMIFFYSRSAGTVADMMLLLNIFLIFGVLASLNAVLTLPGIAGIVLTLGMAVDANVLIFERIKEELRAGKGVKQAIADGYSNAYSAIIDGNLTTIITGVILYVFGTGPIKGFATTLIIGIVTSLFTSVLLSRMVYDGLLKRNRNILFTSKTTANFLKDTHVRFVNLRKVGYVISTILILASVISLSTRGLSRGIDFVGGRTYVVSFDQPVATSDVAQLLAPGLESSPVVVTYGSDNQVKISTKYKVEDPGAQAEVDNIIYEGLKGLAGNPDKDTFLENNLKSSETVGPTIARDITVKAIWAILFALVGMFLYILLRFRNWQYGLGAIAALVHDVLIVLGIFSLFYGIMPFSMDIDQAFIAAILTVVGYSVNDTVIIFDRIREYLPIFRKRPRKEVIDLALNSTLVRTINTSMTTIMVLLAIFIFGGEVIRGFVFALLLGIAVGTYSSLFVATPIYYETMRRRKGEEKEVQPADGQKKKIAG
ncbi:MAG: protein translocase subunit SecDF [Bacteroidales bacterium]|nr:protein translocase subunit SecDF [Bacteroidales bacterium]MDT8373065.1 protein translocase subunit SecDF [Bacteroidales bacterium]